MDTKSGWTASDSLASSGRRPVPRNWVRYSESFKTHTRFKYQSCMITMLKKHLLPFRPSDKLSRDKVLVLSLNSPSVPEMYLLILCHSSRVLLHAVASQDAAYLIHEEIYLFITYYEFINFVLLPPLMGSMFSVSCCGCCCLSVTAIKYENFFHPDVCDSWLSTSSGKYKFFFF